MAPPPGPCCVAHAQTYDYIVGTCECIPERDAPQKFMSIHFSCMQSVGKPGGYTSEEHFMSTIYNDALSCSRYYMLLWHSFFVKAMGEPLPAPLYTGPPVPVYDAAHDEWVRAQRKLRSV